MLNVVEPVSSGIGGDCFVVYWDAKTKSVSSLNGSGWAPAAASIEQLRRLGYTSMPTFSGHTVTIPGAVAAWCDLLRRHGTMPLSAVLEPAIWTAENGYPVTEFIAEKWQREAPKLLRSAGWDSGDLHNGPPQPSAHELLPGGRAPRPGDMVSIPTLACTLRRLATDGQDYIYRGDFARKASEHVHRYGGWLAPEDMAAYAPIWVEPIKARYRGVTLYHCPPNSQGLLAILGANVAQEFDLETMNAADRVHIMIECMRLAFVHGHHWICDPTMTDIPLDDLCSATYAKRLGESIGQSRISGEPRVGGRTTQGSDTVYLSVVDGAGNACSYINSLYKGTGTGLVVPGTGVSLHNRGALFSLDDQHPNALAPKRRPYHTLMPALMIREGDLYGSFGVMGGYMQPQGHLQVLVNLLDLGLSPQTALDAPRWRLRIGDSDPRGAPTSSLLVEPGWDDEILADLAGRGHTLKLVSGYDRQLFGGGQIILRNPDTGVLIAGSDPRKDGCAAGW
jgi:gamma-glutamyltranspeptidase/glutathione hydrolase